MSKITLKELISKKEALKNKEAKTADVFVKSLGGTITIQAPTASQAKDAQEMKNGDEFMVYSCVVEPNLKDKTLQEEFGIKDPLDIVNVLFDIGEIPLIAVECLKLAGYVDGIKVVNDLKN